jgi:hypothetical protein
MRLVGMLPFESGAEPVESLGWRVGYRAYIKVTNHALIIPIEDSARTVLMRILPRRRSVANISKKDVHTALTGNATDAAFCSMFQFVTVSHPDDIKDRKKQGKLRQHAIRHGIQRSKAERAKKNGVFVAVEMDRKTGQPRKTPTVALTITPAVSLLDPFNTLCGSPERLRRLMRHRK